MKLNTAQQASWKKTIPVGSRAVLVYGPDAGQVDELSSAVLHQLAPDAGDDFQRQVFYADEIASDDNNFLAAALSPSLLGGRPVLRVRGAGDKLTSTLKALFGKSTADDGFIVVQGGDLGKKSSLRALFESAVPDIAALPCYEDDARGVETLIRQFAAEQGCAVDVQAARLLQQSLGSDRLLIRRELEKLRVYIGDRTTVTESDVAACSSAIKALGLDDVAYSALEGNGAASLAAWDTLAQEGESPITVLRALQNLLHRLVWVQGQTASGQPLALALKKLQPPLFFKLEARFTALLRRWPDGKALPLLQRTMAEEVRCKSGSGDAELYFSQFILSVAAWAAR